LNIGLLTKTKTGLIDVLDWNNPTTHH
jgi:hypothetical protein